ncbi:O-antigen ligase family protein [Schleiferiaceae bacterium]|nr:O-antigen ligase family protein [Schleiferiaceae bacterium]
MLGKYKNILWILHVIISFGTIASPATVLAWYGLTIVISVWVLLRTRNVPLNVTIFMLYFAGMEMVIKLIGVGLPHEGIKYTCILLLLIALYRDHSPVRRYWPLGLMFLLLLSIPFGIGELDAERFRQLLSANLSGPILLLLGLYYYLRIPVFTRRSIGQVFLAFVLPSLVTTILLFAVTPDIESISFSTNANFSASGYGPNQMSSALGIAATFLVFSLLYNYKIVPTRWLGVIFLGLVTFRIVLTFSRGGLFTLLLLSIIMIVLFLRSGNVSVGRRLWIVSIFSGGLIVGALYLFNNVNAVSGGALEDRLFGEKQTDGSIDINDYSSGRLTILLTDLAIFSDNILGIGPGMGYYERKEYGYPVNVSAHIEYSRLLAEHGLFGLVVLVALLWHAYRLVFMRCNAFYKSILIIFLGSAMLFMAHSATRIAAPMILFALTAVFLPKSNADLQRLKD